MNLTISRKEWLRGEKGSYLLRAKDQKRCCVGIYLRALGCADAALAGRGSVIDLSEPLPKDAKWLTCYGNGDVVNSSDGTHLYECNDKYHGSEDGREASIAAVFARHGIIVTFTD